MAIQLNLNNLSLNDQTELALAQIQAAQVPARMAELGINNLNEFIATLRRARLISQNLANRVVVVAAPPQAPAPAAINPVPQAPAPANQAPANPALQAPAAAVVNPAPQAPSAALANPAPLMIPMEKQQELLNNLNDSAKKICTDLRERHNYAATARLDRFERAVTFCLSMSKLSEETRLEIAHMRFRLLERVEIAAERNGYREELKEPEFSNTETTLSVDP